MITLVRSWPWSILWGARGNAEQGVAWVERRKAGILKAFSFVHVRMGGSGVTGVCVSRSFRCGRWHRHQRRIRAHIPARYPHTTYHSVTSERICLEDAAEAVVFILGHETAHIVTSSERQAEDRGLRWLAAYRSEVAP